LSYETEKKGGAVLRRRARNQEGEFQNQREEVGKYRNPVSQWRGAVRFRNFAAERDCKRFGISSVGVATQKVTWEINVSQKPGRKG